MRIIPSKATSVAAVGLVAVACAARVGPCSAASSDAHADYDAAAAEAAAVDAAAAAIVAADVYADADVDDRGLRGTQETRGLQGESMASKGGVALPGDNGNRAGASSPLLDSLSRAARLSWFHTGDVTAPEGVDPAANGVQFVSEITKRKQISDIRNGSIRPPRGVMGLMAFCGEETSTFEAASTMPIIKSKLKQPFEQSTPDLVICANSAEWIESFDDVCPKHQGMKDPSQVDLACSYTGIGIKSYACNVADLQADVERFARFGKQIWLNEIICKDDPMVARDPNLMAKYILAARDYLDNEKLVARYSFGSVNQINDNKAGVGADLLDPAALFDSKGPTPMGAVVLGLPGNSDDDPFYSCDNERASEFIKKYQDVTKTFIVNGEEVELTKTKKKRRTCEWLERISKKESKRLKFNKYCNNDLKARDVCPGVCVGLCHYAEALN